MAKVMIVDDDRSTTKLLQTLLEMDGFNVAVAGRGADVMPLAQKFMPDIILMDYHLSDMHGVDVIRQLRLEAAFSTTPIVVASGMDVETEVMGAGANGFLVKPFDPDDLPKIFAQLLGS